MAIYHEDIVEIELNSGSVHRSFLNCSIGYGDELANRFGIRAVRNGQPENITGTCTGYFVRNDGSTVIINNGTVNGNEAYVTLPEACYAVEGNFTLAIKCVGGGVTGTLRIIDGTVSRTSTDTAVDPGTVIPSVDALIEAIEEAAASIPQDYTVLSKSAFAAFIVQSNPIRNIEYNTSTKVLTFPSDSAVLYGNKKTFGAPGSLDLASDLASYYAVCIWALDNDTLAVTGYTQQPASNNPHLLGYVYRDTVWMNGVNPSNIKLTDGDTSYFMSEKTNQGSYVAIHSGVYEKYDIGNDTGSVIYDRTNKSIYFGADSFFIYRGKAVGDRPYTVDLSDISGTSTFAFKLFLKSDGTIYGTQWNNNAVNPADDCIGYGYNDAIWIEGVPQYAIEQTDHYKKVWCFGDSIVEGYGASTESFHMLFHRWNRDIHCYNWGVGGSGWVTTKTNGKTAAGAEFKPADGDMVNAPAQNNVIGMMQYVDESFDNVIIMAGTNDYGANVSEASFTTAVQTTLDYILQKTGKILVITPLRRYYQNVDAETPNGAGMKLSDYSAIIMEECTARGIPYVEGYKIAINPKNATQKTRFAPDGLHPNDDGHARIANHAWSKFCEAICMKYAR